MQIQICTKRNIQIHIQVHFYMQWKIQCGFKDKYKCGEGGPDMRQGNIAQHTQALRPGAQICICSFVPTRIFGLLRCASDLLFQETCLVITGCRCIHCWQKLGTWIPWLHKKWSLSGFLDQTLHNHDIYVFHSKVELASTLKVGLKGQLGRP